ncbi:radical SAM/SPASM domain-containing protein [Bradyrhizobium cytisi]|uniref:4Fe4S-binding SPASM domain-containing protein n=1 Tax=Bradyrhizobium cytisi TaxID=515489 RepID=A0A5S4VZG7_9BRAD|nr:radical SAM/SPASM domain-containing protein [Bradyrhizobium cytisi]TYL71019.1 hypothetical protein FXB38_40780 [Bradyrhizobium cytisi]
MSDVPAGHELYEIPEQDVLVLNYTMACPLSCDFCCYGCHPGRKEKIPFENARSLISQASELTNFTSVGFTGGEVFTFEDELFQLSQHLRCLSLPFTIATAAHWAYSAENANRVADILVGNGLRRINISYDDAHAKFIPSQFICYAAEAFAKRRTPVYIIGTFGNPDASLERMLPALSDRDFISLRTKRIARVGRAAKAKISYDDILPEDRNTTCYRQIHHDVVVFWDGKVYPCCSTFNRSTKGICIGNAFEEPLRDIWERIEGSLLLKLMKRRGFEALLDTLSKYDPAILSSLPRPDQFPGACSYCNKLFGNEKLASMIFSAVAKYELDQIMTARAALVDLLGEGKVATFLSRLESTATVNQESLA